MIHPLLEGIFLGLTVSISLGPALVALLQTSIKNGLRMGIFLALGIFSSDLLVVFGVYFGATRIITYQSNHMVFGLIGGIVLLIFGLVSVLRKVPMTEQVEAISEIRVRKKSPLRYYAKGFILNMANPFLWAFWVTSVLAISSSYRGNRLAIAIFFAGTLGTVLTMDIVKCILANKIKVANNPYVRLWINRIVGIIFIIFGIFVIVNVFWDIPMYFTNH
jgi:threonine/homoserine/homoserine lactone efflux protein